jgi:hypothetical protein
MSTPLAGEDEDARHAQALRVTKADLHDRMSTYLINHYLALHVTVVSVALGVAGIAAASLVGDAQLGVYRPLFWIMWSASLLATAAAYAGTVTGSVGLPGMVPSMWDLMVPIFLAVAEFLLFAILVTPLTGLGSPRSVVTAWFFCLGGFGILAGIAIGRARHLFQSGGFGADVMPTIEEYLKRLVVDMRGAGLTAGLGILGGALQLILARGSLGVAYGFAIAILVILTLALISHGKTAKLWREGLAAA